MGSNIKLTIYRFTGWQGLFKIPESWCLECDLLVRATQQAIQAAYAEESAELTIRPWFPWFWRPLLWNRAWHAPILTVNGRLVSAGIVPPVEEIAEAIRKEGRHE
jgi:hypothetical protein